jgi:hypothetical protein
LGNRRIVFANTFESVKNLWITNQSALISRVSGLSIIASDTDTNERQAYLTYVPYCCQ